MGRILTLFVVLGLLVGGVAHWRAARSGSEGTVAPAGEGSALGAAQEELLAPARPESNESARAAALASEREPLEASARARATVNAARAGSVPALEGELFGRVVRTDGDRSIPTSSHGALLFPGSYRLRAHPDSPHARSEEPCSAMVEREFVVDPLDRELALDIRFE